MELENRQNKSKSESDKNMFVYFIYSFKRRKRFGVILLKFVSVKCDNGQNVYILVWINEKVGIIILLFIYFF